MYLASCSVRISPDYGTNIENLLFRFKLLLVESFVPKVCTHFCKKIMFSYVLVIAPFLFRKTRVYKPNLIAFMSSYTISFE